MLHPTAPWSIRRRALEALIWLAHTPRVPLVPSSQSHASDGAKLRSLGADTKGSSEIVQRLFSPRMASPNDMAESVSSRATPSNGTKMCSGGDLLFRCVRDALIDVGLTLPIAALVELAHCLHARVATDARREPLVMRVALVVVTAWFKAAPCEVLSEALQKTWEVCLKHGRRHRRRHQSVASAGQYENYGDEEEEEEEEEEEGNSIEDNDGNMARTNLASEKGKCEKKCNESLRLLCREAVLESLYDILDWRLLQSRPEATITVDDAPWRNGGAGRLHYCPTGVPATDAWSSAAAAPTFAQQWTVLQRAHRKALHCLALHATALSGFRSDVDAFRSNAPQIYIEGSDQTQEGKETSNVDKQRENFTMAWGFSSAVTAISIRLQKGAVTGATSTRRICVKGLCRIALRIPDPTRFALYCFLRDLQNNSELLHQPLPCRNDPGSESRGEGSEESNDSIFTR